MYLNLAAVAKAVGHDAFLKTQLDSANTNLSQQLTSIAGDLSKQLETENAKLKRLLADAMLDKSALEDVLAKKW